MADLNNFQIMARLSKDPHETTTAKGTTIADFTLATNRTWGKDEKQRKETLFIDCVAYNRLGKVVVGYLFKGREIYAEGFLRLQTWDDITTGQKRTKIQMVVTRIQFLDKKKRPDSEATSSPEPESEAAPQEQPGRPDEPPY